MKKTTMTTLALLLVMGMAVLPGLALSDDTGVKQSESAMMKGDSGMMGNPAGEKAVLEKEEMASGKQEPMAVDMGKTVDPGEMQPPMAGEMSSEMGSGDKDGTNMMK